MWARLAPLLGQTGMSTSQDIDDPGRLGLGARLRFLAKDSVLYGGATAINKAFTLITFPILARYFSVEQYGTIDFYLTLSALLAITLVFGQDSAVARFFYEYLSTDQRKQVISQSLFLQATVVAGLLPPAVVAVDIFSTWIPDGLASPTLLRIVILQAPFLLLINFSQNVLKWTFRRSHFIIVSVGSTVCTVAVLLLALVSATLTVEIVIRIYLGVQAGFGLLGLYFVRHWITWPRRSGLLAELTRYAVPFGIVCVIGAAIPTMQRGIVVTILGAADLGLFAAAVKVAMVIMLPVRAFQIAWGPFSMALHRRADAVETYNWVLNAFAIVMCAGALALAGIAEPTVKLFASTRYAGAGVVVFGLAFALIAESIGWILSIGISLSKKSYLALYENSAFLGATLFAIVILVETVGLIGVAWGTMVGYTVKAAVGAWLGQRVYPLPWRYEGIVKVTGLCLGIGLLSQFFALREESVASAIVAWGGVPIVLLAGWYCVMNSQERRKVVGATRRVMAGWSHV